jgi:hypothetical protein
MSNSLDNQEATNVLLNDDDFTFIFEQHSELFLALSESNEGYSKTTVYTENLEVR